MVQFITLSLRCHPTKVDFLLGIRSIPYEYDLSNSLKDSIIIFFFFGALLEENAHFCRGGGTLYWNLEYNLHKTISKSKSLQATVKNLKNMLWYSRIKNREQLIFSYIWYLLEVSSWKVIPSMNSTLLRQASCFILLLWTALRNIRKVFKNTKSYQKSINWTS